MGLAPASPARAWPVRTATEARCEAGSTGLGWAWVATRVRWRPCRSAASACAGACSARDARRESGLGLQRLSSGTRRRLRGARHRAPNRRIWAKVLVRSASSSSMAKASHTSATRAKLRSRPAANRAGWAAGDWGSLVLPVKLRAFSQVGVRMPLGQQGGHAQQRQEGRADQANPIPSAPSALGRGWNRQGPNDQGALSHASTRDHIAMLVNDGTVAIIGDRN